MTDTQIQETRTEVATFLFTDIEDSSGWWERHPRPMRAALELHDDLLKTVMLRNGGTVFSLAGDGFGVSFDRAEAALAAACDAQAAMAQADWPEPIALRVRIGLNSGPSQRRDQNHFGNAVNRAARVADAGHGGQVLISGATVAMLETDSGLVDLGTYELRGLREPERIWWLPLADTGEAFPPLRTVRAGGHLPPPLPTRLRFDTGVTFIGRERPLADLLQVWDAAKQGGAPVVSVAGELGVGKTRLVAEAARRVISDGGVVLYGRSDRDQNVPYQPIAEALSEFVDTASTSVVSAAFAESAGVLRDLVPALDRHVSASHSSLPSPGRFVGLAASSPAMGDRHRASEAVSATLARLATLSAGVVLVLDDLHWADSSTLALLEHLALSSAPSGVATVLVHRETDVLADGAVERTLDRLSRRDSSVAVTLHGLDVDEVAAYVAASAGHELGALRQVVDELYDNTAGNPLFVGELIRHLVDTDTVVFDGYRWTVGQLDRAGVPRSIGNIIRSRVRSIGPAATELLDVGSVFGRRFDLAMVSAVLGRTAAELAPAVASAVAAGLIEQAGDGQCSFVQPVARRTIYDDLDATRRTALHVAAARALESSGDGLGDRSALAHHWGKAASDGFVAEAVRAARAAGDAAVALAAHHVAIDHYRAALAHCDLDPATHAATRAEVALSLAEALNLAGQIGDAEKEFFAVADQARLLDRHDLLASAALGVGGDLPSTPPADARAIALVEEALDLWPGPTHERVLLLSRLVERRHRVASASARAALTDEAIEIAESLDDRALTARAMLSRVRSLHGPDSVVEALDISEKVDRIAAVLPDDALAIRAAQVRLHASFALGDLRGAVHAARVTSVLSERLGQPEYLRLPLMWEAFQATYEGRFDDAAAIMRTLRRVLIAGQHSQTGSLLGALMTAEAVWRGRGETAHGVTIGMDVPYVDALLAWFSAEAGAMERARHHLKLAPSIAEIEEDRNWSWWQAMVAIGTAAVLCDDKSRLADVRDAVQPWADQHATAGLVSYFGSGHHHLGVFEAALGDLDSAIDHLEQGMVAHAAIGARPHVAASQIELARTLDRRGRRGDVERAAVERERALETARELGLESVQARA